MTIHKPIVRIFHTRVDEEIAPRQMQQYLALITPAMQDTVTNYHNWRDRQSALFGKLLLRIGLHSFGIDPGNLSQILWNDFGRPFLHQGANFNLSHSGNQVVCAVSLDTRLGIDIEQVRQVDLTEFHSTMTTRQWKEIYASGNPIKEFFRLWALKESVIKADGRGLSIPLASLETGNPIKYENNSWYLTPVDSPEGYAAFLSSDLPDPQIEYTEVKF